VEDRQIWPSFETVQDQLVAWQREHPRTMKLQVVEKSAHRRGIYAAELTDPTADDNDKQHVLLTANHAGQERTGTTSILSLMRWLLGDDPLAREILRRQIVVCMPISVPDSYVQKGGTRNVCNVHGLEACDDWTLNGPIDPEHNPEGVALQTIMDRYQPEVHADYHGHTMAFPGQMAIENSAEAYGSISLRPYHRRITQLMDQAALAEGYPSDTGENDAERQFWGPVLDEIAHKLWPARTYIYAGMYCYNRYHSMVMHSEVHWERSGFLKHRRLLQVGNEVWPGEYYAGYPTRVIMRAFFDLVVAYGQTAAERRASRVELWNAQQQIIFGENVPQKDGTACMVCATSTAAAERWLTDKTLKGLAQMAQEHPGMNAEPICRFLDHFTMTAGQWGAEPHIRLCHDAVENVENTPIEHGLSLRLRIPYSKARLTDLRMNGRPIATSETDGYFTYTARGYTYVQVNIPPETSRQDDLFVITCEYDPGEKRTHGQW